MPYHPTQLRPAPWRIITVALLIGLLVGAYVWSFRAGRQQLKEGRPRTTNPSATVATPPVPAPDGRPTP